MNGRRRVSVALKWLTVFVCVLPWGGAPLWAQGGSGDPSTLRWVQDQVVLPLDPHVSVSLTARNLLRQIYEPLVEIAPDGSLDPVLAVDWEPVDSDPSVWRFVLRDGVRFHDDSLLNARDVEYSLWRASQSASFERLSRLILDIQIDQGDLLITLSQPYATFPTLLSDVLIVNRIWSDDLPQTLGVARGGAESLSDAVGDDWIVSANGTGPYQMNLRQSPQLTILKQFSDYWGREDFPLDVQSIEVTVQSQSIQRLRSIQVTSDPSGSDLLMRVPVEDVLDLMDRNDVVVQTFPENRVIFFALNVDNDQGISNDQRINPLNDPRVRQAFGLAIDRQDIVRSVLDDRGKVSHSLVPGWVFGANQDLLAREDFADPIRARRLMIEAGYRDGFPLNLYCTTQYYTADEAICKKVALMLGGIGVTVTSQSYPIDQYIDEVIEQRPLMFMLGWSEGTFDSLFVQDALAWSNGSWNLTGLNNAQIDRLLEQIRVELDPSVRESLMSQVWQILDDERVYLAMHQQFQTWAHAPRFQVPTHPQGLLSVKRIRLDDSR